MLPSFPLHVFEQVVFDLTGPMLRIFWRPLVFFSSLFFFFSSALCMHGRVCMHSVMCPSNPIDPSFPPIQIKPNQQPQTRGLHNNLSAPPHPFLPLPRRTKLVVTASQALQRTESQVFFSSSLPYPCERLAVRKSGGRCGATPHLLLSQIPHSGFFSLLTCCAFTHSSADTVDSTLDSRASSTLATFYRDITYDTARSRAPEAAKRNSAATRRKSKVRRPWRSSSRSSHNQSRCVQNMVAVL